MTSLSDIASPFIEIAHRIVWATVATVDPAGRPRSRVLHPLWEWDSESGELVGWIATGPTPIKVAHLEHSPFVSVNYWDATQDIVTAECAATWKNDDDTRQRIWDAFLHAPAPVGYDPAIIPPWKNGPFTSAFGVLRLEPWWLRVFPGTVLFGAGGEVLDWHAARPT